MALLLSFIVLTSFAQEKKCDFEDGRYKIKYKTEGYKKSDRELLILKNNYTIIENDGKRINGLIDWLGKCSFCLESDQINTLSATNKLKSKSIDSASSITRALIYIELSKDVSILLGQGRIYYELNKKNKSRYYFRISSTAMPHVTIAEGYIKRLRRGYTNEKAK